MNLSPRTSSSKNSVAHKGEEVAFVMEGNVNFYLNSEILLLNKGDSIKLLSYTKHR